MSQFEGSNDASEKRFVIVVSRWNEFVTKELLEGAQDELRRLGEPKVAVVHVPGAWEIPMAIKAFIDKHRPDGAIALGCILQGQTPHAGILASDVASKLMSLQLETGVPISWGVLTPDTQDQAIDRAGMKLGNKGREAAQACVEMANLLTKIGA